MSAAGATTPARRRAAFAEAVRQRTLRNGARLFVLENHFNPTFAVSHDTSDGACDTRSTTYSHCTTGINASRTTGRRCHPRAISKPRSSY